MTVVCKFDDTNLEKNDWMHVYENNYLLVCIEILRIHMCRVRETRRPIGTVDN